MTNIPKANEKTKTEVGLLKKMKASVCKHCPACKHARKNPESIIGRVLHHPLHSKHCPVWKAYQEVYGEE
jgi:hypothetical protein